MSIITENAQNKKQVLKLNELEKRKVVENNALITSVAKMQKTSLKMFELAVSCIDTENLPENNTVYLSKAELFSFFEVASNSKHTQFKEAIKVMQKESFFEIKEEKGKGFKFKSIVPIPYVEWNDYNDEVTIQFSEHIMPYLINLKSEFTQYKISEIQKLNSKYSIILYRWLSMNYNQYEHYSNKGGRREEQVESYRNPTISIRELREMTDTVKEYQRFTNFSRKILDLPLKEINAHTSFNVSYDKVKKGRSVDSIVFHIEKKPVARNDFYKLEEQDPIYLQDKANKEQAEELLAGKALKSKYTKLLLDNMLLSPYEMTDTSLM
ncbi:MAG: RepB family plasmid replication initiator protein, partial [Lactococcus lactis]|nr:RepB family plasmid replication initiator protein [Lactococcus lactis]